MDKKIEYNVETNNRIHNRASEATFTFKCRDCGTDVQIPLGKILWFHDSGLIVPTRCKKCAEEKNKKFEKSE